MDLANEQKQYAGGCKTEQNSDKNTHRFTWFDKVPTSTERRLKLSTMLYGSQEGIYNNLVWQNRKNTPTSFTIPRGSLATATYHSSFQQKKNTSLNSFPPLSTPLNSDIGLLFLHKCDSLNMSRILQQRA